MALPVTTNTPSRIIRLAMQDANLLQQGDDPNSDDYAEYLGRLNDMVNLWQTDGLRLWLNEDLPITLTAGVNLYPQTQLPTPPMKPLRVIQAYFEDQFQIRRPLIALSRDDYTRLSQVVQPGQLNSYFVDKQQTSLDVFFWLTPDAIAALGTAHLIIQYQVENATMLNDQMNFPIEWFIALRWGLADEIATGQPMEIQQKCAARAAEYKEKLDNWDVEDASTVFQPDQRATQNVGGFR